MEEHATRVTREQYREMLIDASCWEASEMESGFLSWCERHVPIWRKLGYDETWIRQRIETAQSTRSLHRTLKEQGLTMLEIREELRKMYVVGQLPSAASLCCPLVVANRTDTARNRVGSGGP
jgi:hypothetical protein